MKILNYAEPEIHFVDEPRHPKLMDRRAAFIRCSQRHSILKAKLEMFNQFGERLNFIQR